MGTLTLRARVLLAVLVFAAASVGFISPASALPVDSSVAGIVRLPGGAEISNDPGIGPVSLGVATGDGEIVGFGQAEAGTGLFLIELEDVEPGSYEIGALPLGNPSYVASLNTSLTIAADGSVSPAVLSLELRTPNFVGTVEDANGFGVLNAGIQVTNDDSGDVFTMGTFDTTGLVTLVLAPGDYTIIAGAPSQPALGVSPALNVNVNASGVASPASAALTLPGSQPAPPLSGVITGPGGVRVPRASVQLFNEFAGGGAMTNADGEYSVRNLPPGTYQMRVELNNSNPMRLAGEQSTVTIGAPQVVDVALEVGNLNGRVTLPGGAPAAGADIHLFIGEIGFGLTHVGFARADGSGNYALAAPDGNYVITFGLFGSNPEYLAPQMLSVTAPAERNVVLAPGTLRGRLFAPDGVAKASGHLQIQNLDSGQHLPVGVPADRDGRFAVTLDPGTYRITATPSTSPGVPATFAPSSIEVVIPDPIPADPGYLARNILLANANVRGTVFQIDGTTPLAHSWLEVRDVGTGNYLEGANTAFDGTFALSLPAGQYDLTARPRWDDTSGAVATTRRVTVAGELLEDQDISLQGSNVSGRVFQPDGSTAVANTWVEVQGAFGQHLPGYFANTNANGDFALKLPAGKYKVVAHAPHNNVAGWTKATLDIEVPESGTLTGRNITLGSANVTGQVRVPLGLTGIGNVYVEVINRDTGAHLPGAGAPSRPDGTFALNLPAGNYRLRAHPPQFNPNNYSIGVIDVTVGATPVSDVVLRLQAANVTGTVFQSGGETPSASSSLNVRNAVTGMWLNDVFAHTSREGTYGLVLPAGTYDITARPPWNGTTSDTATTERVVVAGDAVVQNFTLGSPNVTGRVLSPDGTQHIVDSFIDVRGSDGRHVEGSFATTNSTGNYALTLPAGSYVLTARPSWNNPNGYVQHTRDITVGGSPLTAQHINLRSANVTGTVSAPGVGNIPNASIEVFDRTNQTYVQGAWAQTRSDGSYGLTLPEGQYRFTVRPPWDGANLSTATQNVDVVNADDTTTASISLGTPNVTGTVFDGATAVSNSWIEVVRIGSPDVHLHERSASTKANGSFALTLEPGTYRLTAHPSWNNPNNRVRTSVQLVVDGTEVQDINLIGANVTGEVVDSDGNPIRDVWLEIRKDGQWIGHGNTNASGAFGLSLPSDGDYQIVAHPPWNNSQGWTRTARVLNGFDVEGAAVTGFDITLSTGNVTGTVRSPSGAPIRDAYVQVFAEDGTWLDAGSSTSTTGTFALSLDDGTYTLRAYPAGNNPDGLVEAAETVVVTDGAGTATITLGTPNVSGRLLAPTGSTGITNAHIGVLHTSSQTWVRGVGVGNNGVFNLHLPAGQYDLVGFPAQPNADGYAPGRLTVTVPASGALTNLEVRLVPSTANVTGTVTSSEGDPVVNGFVQVFSADGLTPLEYSAPTRAGGAYSLTLPNGTYQLRAQPPAAGDGEDDEVSEFFLIVVNDDTHDIDLELQPPIGP